MGLFGDIIRELFSDSSPQPRQSQTYRHQESHTPEEWFLIEQEEAGELWHGVPLYELSKLARWVYHGKYVKVDQYGFLEVFYTSNPNKTMHHTQCDIDEDGQLYRLTYNYYNEQWKDSADDFIEMANQQFTFR